MSSSSLFIITIALVAIAGVNAQTPAQKAETMLKQMTLEDKVQMLHGWDGGYVGNVQGNVILQNKHLSLSSCDSNDNNV